MIDMSKLMPSAWTGSVTGLRLDPAMNAGVQVQLDWVWLSSQQTTTVINWNGTGLSGNVTIALDDGSGYAPLRYFPNGIVEQTIAATALSFTMPGSLAPGTYTVRVGDGGGWAVSAAPWVFKPAPIAELVAPSYTSGPDFAATVLGNPWDMSGTDDIDPAQTENLSYSINGGVLDITSLVNTGGCSAAHLPLGLNMHGQAVDSNTYKYLTYRYKADQTPNQGGGGIMRVRWQATNVEYWPSGRTDDISLYHNQWQIYKLDLSQVALEGELADWHTLAYNTFQLMAHESTATWTSHLDWVRLTSENTAQGSYLVKWNLAGATGENLGYSSEVITKICWVPAVGSTLETNCTNVPTTPPSVTPPPGPLFVYLPIVLKNYGAAGDLDNANFAYSIPTTGLTVGQSYYVALKLQDGYNTVWWYSELPVRIMN
ncbi:MAG: hypothetical protein JW934_21060 [Anaerolineae bacterium]|nr:hypothetical protein [Anaerolineae bacterium]